MATPATTLLMPLPDGVIVSQEKLTISQPWRLYFQTLQNSLVSTPLGVPQGGTGNTSFTQGGVVFVGPSGLSLIDDAANFYFDDAGNRLAIGSNTPTAGIDIRAGSAAAGTAPLKFHAGTLLTTPEVGAMEFDGTNFFLTTAGPTRHPVLIGATSLTPGRVPYVDLSGNLADDATFLFDDATDLLTALNLQMTTGGTTTINSQSTAVGLNAIPSARNMVRFGGGTPAPPAEAEANVGIVIGLNVTAALGTAADITSQNSISITPTAVATDLSPHIVVDQVGVRIRAANNDPNITVTNAYGLFVDAISAGATLNRAAFFGSEIDVLGNVGVGTTTASIAGPVGGVVVTVLGSTTQSVLELASDRTDANNTRVGEITFFGTAQGSGAAGRLAAIRSNTSGATAGNRGGDLRVFVKQDASALLEKIRMTEFGTLITNTTAHDPNGYPLEVEGAPGVILSIAASATPSFRMVDGANPSVGFTCNVDRFQFNTNNGTGAMWIDVNQLIGFGTSNPVSKCHIEGPSGWIIADEQDTDPTTGQLDSLDSVAIYNKNDKFVIAFNNAGTITYISIPLDGATTAWTQNTTPP